MKCKCFDQIDEKLRPHGLQLSTKLFVFVVNNETLSLETGCVWPLERKEGGKLKSGQAKTMRMSHCPFCGEKLNDL